MKEKKKYYIAIGGVVLVSLAVLLFSAYGRYPAEESSLYHLVTSYRIGEADWDSQQEELWEEGSAEACFLQGLETFAAGDLAAAQSRFEEALTLPGSDPALEACLYYYLNQCFCDLNGIGDYDTIRKGLQAASRYAPLGNDVLFLWDMVETIALTGGMDVQAIQLMQDYLLYAEDLELYAWAGIKNCIAMLEYNNEQYAQSIRNFYDVELALENVERTPEIWEELSYAQEYIANIYYIFEDYENTVRQYQELIDSLPPQELSRTYGCYLNMSSACLEMDDLEGAETAAYALQQLLPQMKESEVLEVEASLNDVLANIRMREGNYAEAEAHLKKAEAFYQDPDTAADIFYGAQHIVTITRCRYMVHEGKLEEAEQVLLQLLENEEILYFGMEKDVRQLLLELYEQTGDAGKQAENYRKLLELEEQFNQTIQREYLAFSAYYRDVNRLETYNAQLTRTNTLALVIILVISVALLGVLILIRRLRTRNVTDQLTGVYNRKKLNLLTGKYKRNGTPEKLGVVMMDIDFFKRYNDTYGHPAGDVVLREVAKVIKEAVRRNDLVIRYGGEEFLVLLQDVPAQMAEEVCQRIHRRLKERALVHEASETAPYVTLSMGLCYQEEAGKETLEQLIEYADECLYHSKQTGRNRVTVNVLQ